MDVAMTKLGEIFMETNEAQDFMWIDMQLKRGQTMTYIQVKQRQLRISYKTWTEIQKMMEMKSEGLIDLNILQEYKTVHNQVKCRFTEIYMQQK